MLKTNSFDTICHEHLEFYALKQLDWILDVAGLKIIDADLNSVNGGSISVTATHKSFSNKDKIKEDKLKALRLAEISDRINDVEVWDLFRKRVQAERDNLIKLIKKTKENGGHVYGLGASTKGNVLLQHYCLTKSEITAIFEVNDEKFGSVTPGGEIPIIDEDQLPKLVTSKDIILVLPWHFKSFFLDLPKFKNYTLVFPLPVVNRTKFS